MQSTNPATGQVIANYQEHTPDELRDLLDASASTFTDWRRTSIDRRSSLLRSLAEVLRDNAEEHARLMALEVGKPIGGARSEVMKSAWVCDYYADHGAQMLRDRPILTERRSYVHNEPLGAVLAIMPWNFPFWQVLRFAAPAIMAGNTAVLKHASNVTGCALAIGDAFHQAGFPKGVFSVAVVATDRVAGMLQDPTIVAVSLTGSESAGRAVASEAGRNLKRSVLELGGSDPYLILDDADIAQSVEACSTSRMINAGQSCIAAKRFIVDSRIHDEWLDAFVQRMRRFEMGDPMEEETLLGPMVSVGARDQLHDQVLQSVEAGARLVLGGEVPEGPGAYYPATVLSDVPPGAPAYTDELFGPVAAVIKVDSEDEAIAVANDSQFGLGAAVFTDDRARGERIAARELEAGCCSVNTFVASDPRLPFGGIKSSGYGRELSDLGIKEFVNQKTVVVA